MKIQPGDSKAYNEAMEIKAAIDKAANKLREADGREADSDDAEGFVQVDRYIPEQSHDLAGPAWSQSYTGKLQYDRHTHELRKMDVEIGQYNNFLGYDAFSDIYRVERGIKCLGRGDDIKVTCCTGSGFPLKNLTFHKNGEVTSTYVGWL